MLPSGVLSLVGLFVGIVGGRQLRNVREFAEALAQAEGGEGGAREERTSGVN